jgi:hypothetical protein
MVVTRLITCREDWNPHIFLVIFVFTFVGFFIKPLCRGIAAATTMRAAAVGAAAVGAPVRAAVWTMPLPLSSPCAFASTARGTRVEIFAILCKFVQ